MNAELEPSIDCPAMRSKSWNGFQSVLCPVDFSEASRLALRYAEALTVRANATLRVTYANDPLLVAAAAAALHDRHIAKRSAKELQDFTDSTLSARSRKQLRVKTQVSIGDPAVEIMKASARARSDLMVLGTHGLTGADRLLMGSTTLSILQQTTIPVLAVPRTAANPAVLPSASWPGSRIVAALDLEEAWHRSRYRHWSGAMAQRISVAPAHRQRNRSAGLAHGRSQRTRPDPRRSSAGAPRRARRGGAATGEGRSPCGLWRSCRRDCRACRDGTHRPHRDCSARPARLVWCETRIDFLSCPDAGDNPRPRVSSAVEAFAGLKPRATTVTPAECGAALQGRGRAGTRRSSQ